MAIFSHKNTHGIWQEFFGVQNGNYFIFEKINTKTYYGTNKHAYEKGLIESPNMATVFSE